MSDTITIKVFGMSCEHCERRVEKAVSAVDGVKSCKADAKAGTVEVVVNGDPSVIPVIKAAVTDVGYDVVG